tara:strand:+ start:715 stop:1566 length:852 start_codon:yes stop_codon:yes gene_type:complete
MKSSTYIIGEIGINHNGDMDIVKRLIDVASCAGFDAVKFQKRTPELCVPDKQKNVIRDTPWGSMRYIEYKKKIEFGKREYNTIDKYCISKGIAWSASPWDLDSAEFLSDYNLPWVKIASASITDMTLLKYSAIQFPKLILSTGMSTIEQVDQAVHNVLRYKAPEDITLLHCNSSYPAPISDLNLKYITNMQNNPVYKGMSFGYSGHEYGLTPTIATIALGATVVERHITLDKGMWGSDQSCSLEPHAMFKLVRGIRELEEALGTGNNKIVTDDELIKSKTLRK